MPTATDRTIDRLNHLIGAYQPHVQSDPLRGDYFASSVTNQQTAQTRILTAIDDATLPGSAYRSEKQALQDRKYQAGFLVPHLLGVLTAIRDDYADGFIMQDVQRLVHADLFTDFLDMAKELLDTGFKDSAAVLTGSVLEEHLRKLAATHSITITDAKGKFSKADTINAVLGKTVYNQAQRGQVSAWLALRNNAAHSTESTNHPSQINQMIQGVRDFLDRHSV